MRPVAGSPLIASVLCSALGLAAACADAQPRVPPLPPAAALEAEAPEPSQSPDLPTDQAEPPAQTPAQAPVQAPAQTTAQAIVTAVVPAGSVLLRRVGAPRAEPARTGTPLHIGDQLIATDPRALFEVHCVRQPTTIYRLERAFRLLIDVPVDGICHLNVLTGRGAVIAETPTATTGGGVAMISRGTQYALDVTGDSATARCELSVFEGTVQLRSGGEPILQGRSAVWAPGVKSRAEVSQAALSRNATLNARFDVMVARARTPDIDTIATLREMRRLQYESLANPTDNTKRIVLAKRQLDLKVEEQAAYNLKRANVTSDSALRRHNINPAVIRASPVLRTRVMQTPPAALTRPEAAVRLQPNVRRVDTMSVQRRDDEAR